MNLTVKDAWDAGIDALIADNALDKNGFVDALKAVLTDGVTGKEIRDYVDEVITVYNELGIINNDTYASYRNEVVNTGADASKRLYFALSVEVNSVPGFTVVNTGATLTGARDERDNINAAIDVIDVVIAEQPNTTVGRLVRESQRGAKQALQEQRRRVRNIIEGILGDADA